ncbi:hypothetical protein BGZ49_002432 [Haplosporangium sp. Z 27]|nr:hypothetical protein BGZ49_002432 [Haplosporangium sp. Z 27]
MGLHHYMIHFNTGSGLGEVTTIVEENGGKLLPAPRIFPPLLHVQVTEELANILKASQDVSKVDDLGELDNE